MLNAELIKKVYADLDKVFADHAVKNGYPGDAKHGCLIEVIEIRDDVVFTETDGITQSAIFLRSDGTIGHCYDVNKSEFIINDEVFDEVYDSIEDFAEFETINVKKLLRS